ncbi:MAG: hypothetical protein EZS28_029576 [Streblomastix strix]|uniref:Uncharacterized protein n=1 Tax=Streblomastix strix TaxID=222440 RepID=A0A5J4UWS7_9EUKA|nr:MAG: hypothetical protein EZS28_029576 [Streblomastix strix]
MEGKGTSSSGIVIIVGNQTHFSYCSGNNVGGIFFGDNVIQISAQNNTFTNNSHPLQTVNGSADIFFSSKILLDQSGGIVEVCKGYKCSFDSKQKPTGEVKIDGFSSNFASYLNCISQGGYKCEDLPCGGELYIKPEECPYQDEKDGKSISIATIIGIVVGALVGVTTVIIIVIIIMVIQKKKRLRGLTNSDDPELLALILSNPVDFSDLSNTRNSQLQLLMSNEFQQIAVD